MTAARRWVVVGTAWLMTAPAVLLAAWLLAGVPLLAAHAFRPQWAVPAAAALAVPMLLAVRRLRAPELSFGAALAVLVVVGAAMGWAAAHASENLVVRRDPGPYGLIAHWIGVHASMVIPNGAAVFGHDPALSYDSPGFYTGPGDSVQPQFQSGPPLAFAPGVWLAGLHGGLVANAVVAGLALLAVGGLAARLAGPRWAPFAVLALAVAYPQTHTARSPYSETVDQLLIFGALALLYAALLPALGEPPPGARGRPAGRVPAAPLFVAGLVAGAAPIARVDAYVDLMPLAAVVVALAALPGRRPLRAPLALAGGLAVGVAVALADDHWVHYLYVHDIPAELDLLVAAGAALAVLTAAGVALARAPAVRSRVAAAAGRLPAALPAAAARTAAGAVVLAAAGLWFVRPRASHPLTWPADPAIPEIATLQRFQGLAVDGRRTYAEWSLHWLGWWLGPVTVALAAAALAWLAARHVRGRDLPALPFTLVALCAAVVVLYDPKAAGDHPWVERRFVPVVLPAVVVAVTWLLARAARAGRRGRWAAGLGAAAVLVPTVVASASLWGSRTEAGQLAAVRSVCRAAGPDAAVVMLDDPVGLRLAQTVRDLCGVPVTRLRRGTAAGAVARLTRPVAAAGRELVLVGWEPASFGAYAGRAREIVSLTYPADQRLLMKRPSTVGHEELHVWLLRLDRATG